MCLTLARILAGPLSWRRIRPTPSLFAEPSRPRAIMFVDENSPGGRTVIQSFHRFKEIYIGQRKAAGRRQAIWGTRDKSFLLPPSG